MLFQAAFRAGQLTTATDTDTADIERRLMAAAKARPEFSAIDGDALSLRITTTFREGRAGPTMDWHHLSRAASGATRAG